MTFDLSIRAACPIAIILFAAVHPIPSNAATLRCLTAEGRVVYQDTSCPHGAKGVPVDETPNRGFRFAQDKDIKRLNRPPTADPVERPPRPRASKSRSKPRTDAAERRFITTGTSIAEVRRKIGPPDHVVRPPGTMGKRPKPDSPQRWVYLPADEDPQTTTTLTVKGGMVLHVERKVAR